MAKDPNAPPPNVLTIEEVTALVFRYWTDADLSEKAVAVAVCAAETGGTFDASSSLVNTYELGARGASIGSIDRGLWEINSYWHREVSHADAYDPDRNAYHAHRIWQESGNTFTTQWATAWPGGRRNGSGPRPYEAYLEEARDAVSLYNGGRPTIAGGSAPGNPRLTDAPPGSVLRDGHLYTPDIDYRNYTGLNKPRPSPLMSPNGTLSIIGLERIIPNSGGRTGLVYGGVGTKEYLVPKVLGTPQLSLSMSECSQFTIVFDDPNLELVKNRSAMLGKKLGYGGMLFTIDTVAMGGGGTATVTVTARTTAVHDLKAERGPKVVSDRSPTEYAFDAAKRTGLHFLGQSSYRRTQIARGEKKPGTTELGENEWEVLQRLASEIGFVCFEAAGTLVFAKPSWLAESHVLYTHRAVWPPMSKTLAPDVARRYLTPLGVPQITKSINDRLKNVASGSIQLRWEAGAEVRPGQKIRLQSGPTAPTSSGRMVAPTGAGLWLFAEDYLITEVSIPVDGHTPVEVSIATPVDPEPSQQEEFRLDDGAYPGDDDLGNSVDVLEDGAPVPGSSNSFWWPAGSRVTSRFGMRNGRMHEGIDIAPATPGQRGVVVFASYAGTVTRAEFSASYGNVVYIQHDQWVDETGKRTIRSSRYAHLDKLFVKKGDLVARSYALGIMGETGGADGIHLHFEILENEVPVDPETRLVNSTLPASQGGMPKVVMGG